MVDNNSGGKPFPVASFSLILLCLPHHQQHQLEPTQQTTQKKSVKTLRKARDPITSWDFSLLLCWFLSVLWTEMVCFVHPPETDKPHGADPGPHRGVPGCAPGAEGRRRGRRQRPAEASAWTPLRPQPRQPAQLRAAVFITFILLLQQQQQQQQRPQPSIHHQS